MWMMAVNILNKQLLTVTRGSPVAQELGVGLTTTPHHKNLACYKMSKSASGLD